MAEADDHVYAEPETIQNRFQYPFAAAPDIIRSNQKDIYFQGVLLEHLSNILRNLYGARFLHNHHDEAKTFSELLYLGLTTFVGNRTLGEEYCDIVQVEDESQRLPEIRQRSGYILSTILLPYTLARFLPIFRRRLRSKLEYNLQRQSRKSGASFATQLQSYVLTNLDTITSPSPVYALSLAIFYFSGAYYHIGKRLFGLRYVFTKRIEPNEQRVGYEVLGVLLVLQMAVQGYLHLRNTMEQGPPGLTNSTLQGNMQPDLTGYTNNNTILFHTSVGENNQVGKDRIARMTYTPDAGKPRYDLKDAEAMQWIKGRQQRKCTLCLEEMKDPSVTTCGHVFCWTCIGDWVREKPECPLCRQTSLVQHILPLRV